MSQKSNGTKGFMRVSLNGSSLGTLKFVLRSDVVPKTVLNFTTFLTSQPGAAASSSYVSCPFHRIIKGFMAQGGDFVKGDGTGAQSIYGTRFADENFNLRHDRRGTLSMANSGPNTNGCQFFITFRPTPHLDGKHVVFGYVEIDDESARVLDAMEGVKCGHGDRPVGDLRLEEGGLLGGNDSHATKEGDRTAAKASLKEDVDEHDEGDDDDVDDDDEQEKKEDSKAATAKMTPLEQRLFALKMKMNASRKVNRKEVLEEGKRITPEGARKELKTLKKQDRVNREKEWVDQMSGSSGSAAGAPAFLHESGAQAVGRFEKVAEKKDRAMKGGWELHKGADSEAQYLAYEKKIEADRKKKGGGGRRGARRGRCTRTTQRRPVTPSRTTPPAKESRRWRKASNRGEKSRGAGGGRNTAATTWTTSTRGTTRSTRNSRGHTTSTPQTSGKISRGGRRFEYSGSWGVLEATDGWRFFGWCGAFWRKAGTCACVRACV